MWFENIAVQTDNGENAAALRNILTDGLIAAVVETSMRQDDCHTSTGFQEVQVALDKENISSYLILPFTGGIFAQLITGNNGVFFYISGKRRIRHDQVKLEQAVIIAPSRLELLQFFETFVIGVVPIFLLCDFIPAGIIQRVQMKNIRLPIAGD